MPRTNKMFPRMEPVMAWVVLIGLGQGGMLGLAHRGWKLNDYGQHWVDRTGAGMQFWTKDLTVDAIYERADVIDDVYPAIVEMVASLNDKKFFADY